MVSMAWAGTGARSVGAAAGVNADSGEKAVNGVDEVNCANGANCARGVRGLRSVRERVLQTLCFEAGGLLLVSPLVALAWGGGVAASFTLLALLALVVMAWAATFNTAFDLFERRCSGRVASDRPPAWRLVHALLHEASAVLVTWPLIVVFTGLTWAAALAADIALTLVYAAYAYGFHCLYDRWRPVAGPSASMPGA